MLLIHLVYIVRKRKYRPNRTYLYIRYNYSYEIYDFPLGRLDRATPEHIVRFWLEDSDNLPEVFKNWYTLRLCDVVELYSAIVNGGLWGKWEWVALSDNPRQWKCKVTAAGKSIEITIPDDVKLGKTYKQNIEEIIAKVQAEKQRWRSYGRGYF